MYKAKQIYKKINKRNTLHAKVKVSHSFLTPQQALWPMHMDQQTPSKL